MMDGHLTVNCVSVKMKKKPTNIIINYYSKPI